MINIASIDSEPTNILIELNNGGNPWCLKELEDSIIQSYDTSIKYENDKCLVELRSLFLNKITLSHQEQILKPLLEFNESLREALLEMYDRAHEIYEEISRQRDKKSKNQRSYRNSICCICIFNKSQIFKIFRPLLLKISSMH